MINLSSEAHEILKKTTLEDGIVFLPPVQLERDLYTNLASALKGIGGKWERSIGGFRFDRDFERNYESLKANGFFDKKTALDFYATSKEMAREVVSEMRLFSNDWGIQAYKIRNQPESTFRVLEPSAGHGALIDEFVRQFHEKFPEAPEGLLQVECVEIDPVNAGILRSKGYVVHEMDFLEFQNHELFDAIIMNPPFSLRGKPDCYIDHVNHALEMLAKDGELKSIVPASFAEPNSPKKESLISRALQSYGEIVRGGFYDDPTAFSKSGANITTLGLSLNNQARLSNKLEVNWGEVYLNVTSGGTSDLYRKMDWAVRSLIDEKGSIDRETFERMLKPIETSALKMGVFIPKDRLTEFRAGMAEQMDIVGLYEQLEVPNNNASESRKMGRAGQQVTFNF